MSGGLVSRQGGIAECHLVTIVQRSINLCRRIPEPGVVTVLEIAFSARFDAAYVRIHDHVSSASQLFDLDAAGIVIEVSVADQQDLDVFEMKS